MLEMIFLAVLLSSVAAFWDLLTTEVPDEIPALMIASGIFFWYIQALNGYATPFLYSLLIGTAVLAGGLILYKNGKWGGADAWILAAIFYMIPVANNGIFLIDYMYNLLIVSSAYTIVYAIALGLANRYVFSFFFRDLRNNAKIIAISLASLAAVFALIYVYMLPGTFTNMIGMLAFLLFFWRYAQVIEKKVFTKRIPARNVRVGDVLQSMIWRGLTYEEVRKIRKQKKTVVIKEGMRFVPVFPITLVVTLLYGNILFYLI